jgi:glucose-6-phosphate isomerase
MDKLTETEEWQALTQHYEQIRHCHLRELFAHDENRFAKFSLNLDGLLFDFSKNHLTEVTLDLLNKLAEKNGIHEQIAAFFAGKHSNQSEQRPALHTALRLPATAMLRLDDHDIVPDIQAVKHKMADFCRQVESGEWRGVTGEPITDIVNIGIGGSDLGPMLVTEALASHRNTRLNCHFISNCDGYLTRSTLQNLHPGKTLFLIASKSFTTRETMLNANTAKKWLNEAFGNDEAFKHHFVAITANIPEALRYGINLDQIFPLWDWVGGRYSLWSAVGLPIALVIGMDKFEQLLAGAHAMDQHFLSQPVRYNMPIMMALLGIWYRNFFAAPTYAVLPYDHRLQRLVAYLQQADMESNGKSVTQDGAPVTYNTGPIVWGGVGCNSQHAFHQLLHQGTHLVPVDFIVEASCQHDLPAHHQLLLASCFSQAEALMRGKTFQQCYKELIALGKSPTEASFLAKYQSIRGNQPSNTLILPELSPFYLGALLALYEHKIAAQGMLWHINSFDQWGVELGKQLTDKILSNLQDDTAALHLDSSTNGLINYVREIWNNKSKQ